VPICWLRDLVVPKSAAAEDLERLESLCVWHAASA
jgi:hypothetical protein